MIQINKQVMFKYASEVARLCQNKIIIKRQRGRVNANVSSCHEVVGWSVNVSKGTFFSASTAGGHTECLNCS